MVSVMTLYQEPLTGDVHVKKKKKNLQKSFSLREGEIDNQTFYQEQH